MSEVEVCMFDFTGEIKLNDELSCGFTGDTKLELDDKLSFLIGATKDLTGGWNRGVAGLDEDDKEDDDDGWGFFIGGTKLDLEPFCFGFSEKTKKI